MKTQHKILPVVFPWHFRSGDSPAPNTDFLECWWDATSWNPFQNLFLLTIHKVGRSFFMDQQSADCCLYVQMLSGDRIRPAYTFRLFPGAWSLTLRAICLNCCWGLKASLSSRTLCFEYRKTFLSVTMWTILHEFFTLSQEVPLFPLSDTCTCLRMIWRSLMADAPLFTKRFVFTRLF